MMTLTHIKEAIRLIKEYKKARKEFFDMVDKQIKFANEVIEWSKNYDEQRS